MPTATDSSSASPPGVSVTDELLPPLPPLEAALRLTCFDSWYPKYRKVSPKATVLPIDEIQPDFLDWLEEDGLTLPDTGDEELDSPDGDEHSSAASDKDQEEEEEEPMAIPRRFLALDERIRQVMTKYDGRVFPKLNWSAPRVRAIPFMRLSRLHI